MHYTVHSVPTLPPPKAVWERHPWSTAETLEITHYPWKDSGHHPPTQARLLYDTRTLAVMFRVDDRYVRAVARHFQDSVCVDSCVEFFVAPGPDPLAYFNFEVNCGGTMLVHRCASPAEKATGRTTYDMTPEDGATIAMAHSLPRIVDPEITEPVVWTVEYHLPHALFDRYFDVPPPQPGAVWRGNFYKCGDRTSHPHWGTWAPVGGERPSFHQPEFFQPIRFA